MKQPDLGTNLTLYHYLLMQLKAMSENSNEYGGMGGVTELVSIMTKQPSPEGCKEVVKQHIDLQQIVCGLAFLHHDVLIFYDVDNGRLVLPIDKYVTMSINLTPECTQAVMVAMTIAYHQR